MFDDPSVRATSRPNDRTLISRAPKLHPTTLSAEARDSTSSIPPIATGSGPTQDQLPRLPGPYSGTSAPQRRLPGSTQRHEIKSHPAPFAAVWDAKKTYEVRRDDRAYQEGDELLLREWCPDARADDFGFYTGRMILAKVTHKTPGGQFDLPTDLCVLGVSVVDRHAPRPRAGGAPS